MGTENSNSTMDLECSENPIMTSTRIEDSSSMSLLKDNTLNEGFLIDSGSLSLSAVNDVSANSGSAVIEEMVQESEESQSLIQNTVGNDDDDGAAPNLTGEKGIEDEPLEMELEMNAQDQVYEDIEGDADLASKESNLEMEFDDDEDDEEENAPDYQVPQFPISRVKKIMSICINTVEEEDEADKEAASKPKDKTKGKGAKPGPMLINKEAAYLMSLAAEHFVGTVGEMAGRITVSSKKKTMNLEHLKRALSDTDSFAFLEGCFQPSIIIGD